MKAKLNRLSLRRALAVLGAYLVLLHGVAMGAMMESSSADAAGFVICTAHSDSNGSVPAHSPMEHAPCALCGLGACFAVEAPAVAIPASFAPSLILPSKLAHENAPIPVRIQASQPRGPPL